MKKISLVVSDDDISYIEMLASYIRTSNFASKFDVKLFSKKESLEQYLSGDPKVNVLLCTTSNIPHELCGNIDVVIGLDEQTGNLGEGFPVIFKYQPLAQLLSQVTTIFYEKNGKAPKRTSGTEKTNIISVFSATGGAGKSTVAFNLAKQISSLEYSVFYLNLELLNTTYSFFDDDNDNASSPILYYVKTASEELALKIETLKKYDGNTGIDLFRLLPNVEEMDELTEEDTEVLIKGLVDTGNYDYIIIDLDSTINSRMKAALNKSHHVLWLLNNDIQSYTKTSFFIEELPSILSDHEFGHKVSFVLNRYMGNVAEQFKRFELPIEAYLPYVPEWKEVRVGEQLTSVPVFSEYILKMFKTLFEANRGVVNG
ncbi:MAG: AAA family ATPase [Anaerobacillus sp.]|uniref:AAA family ATPase n=1 Tax=Anaerobacillus sp. TaxID=1872506 RepID=UPI0039192123